MRSLAAAMSLIDILMQIRSRLPDSPTESGNAYDGLMSYAKENHSLIMGLLAGFAAVYAGRVEPVGAGATIAFGAGKAPNKRLEQINWEPWYYGGGVIIGAGFGAIMLAVRASL